MKKFLRLVAGLGLVILAACALLTLLVAGFLVAAIVTALLREGRLLDVDVHLLKRGGVAMLVAGGVLWATWWAALRFLGKEAFGSSFRQVPSKNGERERFTLNMSTVVMFAMFGLLIYGRTRGDYWLRLIEVLGWVLVVFLGLHIRVFLHEIGHLSAAQVLRMRRSKIQIGAGPLLFGRSSRRGLRWEWRLWPQIGFVYAQHDEVRGFKWRHVVFVAAGPFADALMIWAGYTLIAHHFGSLFGAFAENASGVAAIILFWLTTGSAINGLIPHRIHLGVYKLYTDGYWLFHLLLLSDEKAYEFVKSKGLEQLVELARQARMYWQKSDRITN